MQKRGYMVGIVKAGYQWVASFIPPVGIDRNIGYVWLASFITPGPSQGRHVATLATLGLQGRLTANLPLFEWLKCLDKANETQVAQVFPEKMLVVCQEPDLVCKVLAAVAFILTKDSSLTVALSKLLSHSERVSKIARPYLDQMASLSMDRRLPSARVIALAPVIAKLMHMALIYADPKGENSVLELLKTGANKTSQSLEFLLNLRFSLICLAIPKTFYATLGSSIFNLVYEWTVHRFVPGNDILRMILSLLRSCFNPSPDSQSYWNSFLRLIKGDTSWPTAGCGIGLQGMWNSLQASSAPYDIETLESLFNDAYRLDGTLNNLQPMVAESKKTRSTISQALKEGKISEELAVSLNDWVALKKLKAFLQDPTFATELAKEEVIVSFKKIYCPNIPDAQAKEFLGFLKKLHQTTLSTDDLSKPVKEVRSLSTEIDQLIASESMTRGQALVCRQLLFEKVQLSFDNTIIPNLCHVELKDMPAWLAAARDYLHICKKDFPDNHQEFDAWSSAIFGEIFKRFPRNIQLDELVRGEQEQHFREIFGKNGIMHKFATTPEEGYTAYLLSVEFQLKRFNLNLDWYMHNRPQNAQEREKCELLLLQLALEAQFDYEMVASSSGFETWAKSNPTTAHFPPQELVKIYMMNTSEFDFARNSAVPIPDTFVFSTYLLPYIFDSERRQVNALGNTFVHAKNLAAQFRADLSDNALLPDSPQERARELSELRTLLKAGPNQDLAQIFVSSQSIQDTAKT